MNDATLAAIDHEPWNQRPDPAPIAPTVAPYGNGKAERMPDSGGPPSSRRPGDCS